MVRDFDAATTVRARFGEAAFPAARGASSERTGMMEVPLTGCGDASVPGMPQSVKKYYS